MKNLIAATALFASVAVLAQDGSEITTARTVDGAHQFLAELPQSGSMTITEQGFVTGKLFEPVRTPYCPTEGRLCPYRKAHLVAIKRLDKCRSEFYVSDSHWPDSYPKPNMKMPDNPTVYDWRALAPKVEAFLEGMWVYEPGKAIQANFPSLTFPSSDLAKRTAVALQFLREECQKSGSGF